MSKFINGLVGFVVGATAGVVTGLLLAPRKGEETRQLIKDKVKKTSNTIGTEFDDKMEKIQGGFKNYKEKAEETADKVKDKVKSASKKAKKEVKETIKAAKKNESKESSI